MNRILLVATLLFAALSLHAAPGQVGPHGPVTGPSWSFPQVIPATSSRSPISWDPPPEEKTSKEFREVNEPVPYLRHKDQVVSGIMVKASNTEGFLKMENGIPPEQVSFSETQQQTEVAAKKDQDLGNAIIALCFLTLGLLIYFAPTLIASTRQHRNREGIFILNLLLGWTLLGWVVAIIWAVHRDSSGQYG